MDPFGSTESFSLSSKEGSTDSEAESDMDAMGLGSEMKTRHRKDKSATSCHISSHLYSIAIVEVYRHGSTYPQFQKALQTTKTHYRLLDWQVPPETLGVVGFTQVAMS